MTKKGSHLEKKLWYTSHLALSLILVLFCWLVNMGRSPPMLYVTLEHSILTRVYQFLLWFFSPPFYISTYKAKIEFRTCNFSVHIAIAAAAAANNNNNNNNDDDDDELLIFQKRQNQNLKSAGNKQSFMFCSRDKLSHEFKVFLKIKQKLYIVDITLPFFKVLKKKKDIQTTYVKYV